MARQIDVKFKMEKIQKVKIEMGNRKKIQKVNFAARSNIDITISINSEENNENEKERQK